MRVSVAVERPLETHFDYECQVRAEGAHTRRDCSMHYVTLRYRVTSGPGNPAQRLDTAPRAWSGSGLVRNRLSFRERN